MTIIIENPADTILNEVINDEYIVENEGQPVKAVLDKDKTVSGALTLKLNKRLERRELYIILNLVLLNTDNLLNQNPFRI